MTIQQYVASGGGVVFVLLTLLQIAPIKVNPWSAIAHSIGKAINQDVLNRVDRLSDDMKKMKVAWNEDKAEGYRTRILRFGDEIMHNVPHSKEHFDQVLRDIARYDAYCKEHPGFENNVTTLTSQRIKECYKERLEKGDFL